MLHTGDIDSVEASIVVDFSEENLLSLLQRFILRTYATLKAILPVVQVRNVQSGFDLPLLYLI